MHMVECINFHFKHGFGLDIDLAQPDLIELIFGKKVIQLIDINNIYNYES